VIVTHDDSVSSDQQANVDERMVLVVVRLGGSDWGTTKLDDQPIHNRKVEKDNHDMMMTLRSNIKRLCKLGNELEFYGEYAEQTDALQTEPTTNYTNTSASTDWNNWTRFIVDYYLPSTTTNSSENESSNVRIYQALKWNPIQCQQTRLRYFESPPKKQQQQKKKKNAKDDTEQSKSRHSGGGIGKRKQGEIVAKFLLWMLSNHNDTDKRCSDSKTIDMPTDDDDQQYLFMKRWVPLHPSLEEKQSNTSDNIETSISDTTRKSNSKLNILDAAGGAGHVSLALALRGVHSCVVDPRKTIGKLPGRERKVLKKNQASFRTYRAWFGSRPKGVDSFYREGSSDNSNEPSTLEDPLLLPICSMCSEDNLLSNCNAIVALHPDEATGIIVETAVENEIPFLVVPCCVFSRLFPQRIKPSKEGENNIVSTYFELIDWLVAKHPAINVTRLPFKGANLALWATFDNETT